MTKQVLLVDDDAEATMSLLRVLKSLLPDISFNMAANPAAAARLASELKPIVFVLDLNVEPKVGVESGFRLLKEVSESHPDARAIMLTGSSTIEHGVRALELGAASFLAKPADPTHLAALIKDGIAQAELRAAYRKLSRQSEFSLERVLVGNSPAMREIRTQVQFFAQNNQPVFIGGETGTGKGVVAAAIHRLSKRSENELVRYQPRYTNSDLVSSELFGHRKGAFTGATEDRVGLLADADGGTLFLDEIDELPSEMQVTLLGILQERKFRPVGSNDEQTSDFRLVTASNRNIDEAISSGKLRRDFYHRIAHGNIQLPPLRNRCEDIPMLAEHFLQQLRQKEQLNVFGFSESALEAMAKCSWPGNIRELEAVVEGGAYRAQFESSRTIEGAHLGLHSKAQLQAENAGNFHEQIEAFKIKLIDEALVRHGGNQVKAAAELGLDRSTMRRFIARVDRKGQTPI